MNGNFVYTVDGYTYVLKPIFRLTGTKHIRIVGAEMYGRNNLKYYGYWDRSNMPIPVMQRLEGYCRSAWAKGHYQHDGEGKYRVVLD